jgi:hypothetical protein
MPDLHESLYELCTEVYPVILFIKLPTIGSSIVADTQISEVGTTPAPFNFGPEIMNDNRPSKTNLCSVHCGNLL